MVRCKIDGIVDDDIGTGLHHRGRFLQRSPRAFERSVERRGRARRSTSRMRSCIIARPSSAAAIAQASPPKDHGGMVTLRGRSWPATSSAARSEGGAPSAKCTRARSRQLTSSTSRRSSHTGLPLTPNPGRTVSVRIRTIALAS